MGVTVRLDSTEIEAQPGEQAVCPVYLENDGMVVDSYLLDVLGDSAAWATVEPPEINLLPQARATARIVFKPPRTSECPAGPVPFGLRVMSQEDPDGSKIEEGVVNVAEFTDVSAGLVPKTATGRRKAKFRLLVENRGNRVEQVAVSAADPDVKLRFRTDPPVFPAQPGTATYVKLRAIPSKTFLRGPNKSLPFTATALPDGGEPVTADGVMLEQQTMPKWLLPALGALVLVAAAIVALWFAVLRPEVHSAATAASAAQSAASQAAKNASAAATPAANALSITVPDPTLLAGGNEQADVNGTAAVGGAGKLPKLLWTSSAPGVATVSQTGEVTAISPGTATITATSASGSGGQSGSSPIISGTVTVNVVGPLATSTTKLPGAPIGKPYSAPVSVGGGTGTFTYSISAGTLPTGLSIDSATGIISGTPTVLGQSSFTVHVVDAGPPTQFITENATLTVISALQVNTATLPNATINAPYSQTLTAVGGTGPYTWSIAAGTGTLPAGLSLNSGTGVISGTPTAGGTTTFTVKAADAGTPSQSATQQLSIDAVPGVEITTTKLPDAVVGVTYSQAPAAAGGTLPYTWSVVAGSLPPGLTLNPANGDINGAPNTVGQFPFTLQAVDSGKPALIGSQAYTINVVKPFAISTSTLPSAPTGTAYPTTTLAGTGGTAPYTWTLRGTLPPGLKLASTGAINGTPTATGVYAFTVQAADSGTPPLSAMQNLTITIVDPLKITTTSLPYGVTGVGYNQTLDATGGTKPYTWAVASGSSLPPGLSLSAAGVISGTPTTATSTGTGSTAPSPTFSITLTDSTVPTLTVPAVNALPMTLTINIVNPVSFSEPAPLPLAVAGQAYTQTTPPVATGGLPAKAPAPAYTWTLSGGTTLPKGLSVDAATGAVTGTAAATDTAATDTFQLTVTDSSTPALSATNTETINVVSQLTITQPSLPSVQVGQSVSVNLATYIKGGVAPYSVAAVQTGLDGLSLSDKGMLTGSPTSDDGTTNSFDQTVPVTFAVTDSTPTTPPQSTSITVNVTVTPATLNVVFAGSTLPGAISASLYTPSQPTTTSVTGGFLPAGNPTPYTYTESNLPNGLTIGKNTGVISGTIQQPDCVAKTTFTVTVSSLDGQSAQQQFTIACTIPKPLMITTLALPDALAGAQYNQTPSATGGTGPYTWSVLTGSLPPNLSLDSGSGTISGKPTTAGQYSFTLQVSDSAQPALTATHDYTINVVQNLAITTFSLPGAAASPSSGTPTPYPDTTLTATGGTPLSVISGVPQYVWNVMTGALPPGLKLSPSGEITGAPSTPGLYTFTVQVTDAGSPPQSATQSLSITIVGPLSIVTTSVQQGVVNTPYSQTLKATGGTKPYTWTVTNQAGNALPTGLSLDPDTGIISGTPGAATTKPGPTVNITLADSTNPPVTTDINLPITIVSQMNFTEPAPLPAAVAGETYPSTGLPTATGGSGTITWSLAGGTTLPSGLTLTAQTGLISGQVATNVPAGPDTFQLTATDGSTPPLSVTNTETINVISLLAVTNPTLQFQVGQPVNVNLATYINGGLAPYSVKPIFTGLDGLSLSDQGVLTGTPTSDNGTAASPDQTVPIQFAVTDSSPGTKQTVTITINVTITPATLSVSWSNSTLTPTTVRNAYGPVSVVTSGTPPTGGVGGYTFSTPNNALPAGLSLDSGTGVISGTPTSCAAQSTFVVTVTSGDGQTATHTFTLNCTG